MRVSADVDPRPLREVYLRGFRRVVEDAQPWTVMCSYNRVNGVHVSQDPFLLTRVLRDEWGFAGVVVSDWGAVRDRVAAVAAGLDLQMPYDGGAGDAAVIAAVENGALGAAAVGRAAARVTALVEKATAAVRSDVTVDVDAHHELAREAASRSIVLLRNDGDLLPLAPAGSIAVIGEFARTPRYQGGGSSHVNATRVDIPLDEIHNTATESHITFAPGFTVDGSGPDGALVDEAVAIAADSDVAVVFLGLDASQESEGFDRESIDLPAEQLDLLAAVAAVQPRVVVVLQHGGVVRLAPVVPLAAAMIDGALLGQGGGAAIARVLFGAVNPSGRLTETVPLRLEDTPAFLDFPGEHQHVRYGEGLFVGYRWYDARGFDVTFPFGYGLSYTTFGYDGLEVRAEGESIRVAARVTNTGSRAGREIVQVYAAVPGSAQVRVPRALVGFAAVELEPSEQRRVEVVVDRRDLEYWDIRVDRFVLEPGTYEISVGASSRDLRASATVALVGDTVTVPLTVESTIGEAMAHPIAGPVLRQVLPAPPTSEDGGDGLGVDMARMMASIPLERAIAMSGGAATREQLEQLLEVANAAPPAGAQAPEPAGPPPVD